MFPLRRKRTPPCPGWDRRPQNPETPVLPEDAALPEGPVLPRGPDAPRGPSPGAIPYAPRFPLCPRRKPAAPEPDRHRGSKDRADRAAGLVGAVPASGTPSRGPRARNCPWRRSRRSSTCPRPAPPRSDRESPTTEQALPDCPNPLTLVLEHARKRSRRPIRAASCAAARPVTADSAGRRC